MSAENEFPEWPWKPPDWFNLGSQIPTEEDVAWAKEQIKIYEDSLKIGKVKNIRPIEDNIQDDTD